MKQFFYGKNKEVPYFEGWYFKCQTRNGSSLALIPAMNISEDGNKSVSLQVITEDNAWWMEYPASSFVVSRDFLNVRIDRNLFFETGVILNVDMEGLSLHGEVIFGPFQTLKTDIMGPFRWLGNMECAHSVVSMGHWLQGKLKLNGCTLHFDGGMGYIEADRGRSFPDTYLWTQCIWENCSFMLSIATIPFGKHQFTGCICAIVLNGMEHRIATYRGAKIEEWSDRGAILIQGKYKIEVELLEQSVQKLRAPLDGNMSRTVHESLCAKVRYRLWQGGELLLDHTDYHAGFEYGDS